MPKNIQEAEFKGYKLINLVEEISRQPSIQAMTLLLCAALSQVHSENCQQKAQ
jgi:hypothetical protein